MYQHLPIFTDKATDTIKLITPVNIDDETTIYRQNNKATDSIN